MRLEDLAGKWASSWKRSLELMTKLAEQRDDAVRQLEEEWHQHAQSHPESSKPPEAPQLPQPSHQLVEAAAALFPGLQRRQEELKAEAAKREEMLAGLEEVHVVQCDMISAFECQLLERELELERRTIECRAIERCADELERRLQGRGALKTARESLEIDGISVFATGPIHFATAHATATNDAIAANGATAAKAVTAANAAEVVEDEGSRGVRIDKMRALHGLCPYWYP